VRSLAQRSAQAAKETAAKIQGAIHRTGQGVEITGKVAQALTDIVTRARQVDELAAEVASASNEQSQGLTQINTAVGQMDRVTQSNAASAQQSASAAEELNAQAKAMRESVAELLKLVGGQGRGSPGPAVKPAPKLTGLPVQSAPAMVVGKGPRPQHGFQPPATRRGAAPSPSATFKQRSQIPLEGHFKDF
jgi:methyl-accepting chemotaxis protein